MYYDLVFVVTELNVIELYSSLHVSKCIVIPFGIVLFLLLEEFEYSFSSCYHRLQLVGYLSHLLQRLGEVSDVLDERLDIADIYRSSDRKHSTRYRYCYISEVSYKLHYRHHHS